MRLLSSLLLLILEIVLAYAQNGLIRPVRGLGFTNTVNCQVALQSNSAPGTGTEPEGLVIPYHPQCRSDRPELFEARQCSEHDCFCVNVTNGAVFTGTRASPSEVGDCSTALYTVLLALRTPIYNWSSPQLHDRSSAENYRLDDEHVSSLTKTQDAELRDRIRVGLERILKSVGGFQRVVNVKQLITVAQHTPKDPLTGGLIYYRAQIASIGHASLQAPQDLIRHRLHEGHIPNVGYVDSTVSRIDLIESKVVDPVRLIIGDNETPDLNTPALPSTQFQSAALPVQPVQQELPQSKSVIVRSSDPFAPAPVRSPSEKIERESRQLPSSEDDPLLSGAVVAPPPQSDSGAWYHSWFAKSSRVNLLRQPGVIAGIVGSAVAILLLLILFILFCIYRLRKRDEGSYALDESKKTPNTNYHRAPTREFYA